MNGRTEEEIKESISKMKEIAEVLEGEKLELIDSFIEGNPPKTNNQAIWYLGKSIEKLADADILIGITDAWEWRGCQVEKEVASDYGIKTYWIPPEYVIKNYSGIIKKKHEELCCNNVIECHISDKL